MSQADFALVQQQLAAAPGPEGAAERARAYRPYFLRFGADVYIGEGCHFTHPDRIVLDDGCRINQGLIAYGSGGIRVGRHVLIGPRCFIHSANHAKEPAGLAIFERGYEYEAVRIGDNSLLSANVSVLAGASVGRGCFAGAGAVIARGSYPDGARLLGTPARALAPPVPPERETAPEIAFLVGNRRDQEVVRLLCEALRCPQIEIFTSADQIPAGVSAVLAWPGTTYQGSAQLWQLREGPRLLPTPEKGTFNVPTRQSVPLPVTTRFQTAPSVRAGDPPVANAARLTAYYALKRLRKRRAVLTDQERLDVLGSAVLAARTGQEILTAELVAMVSDAFPGDEGRALTAALGNSHEASDLDRLVVALAEAHSAAPAEVKDSVASATGRVDVDAVARWPELLWGRAAEPRSKWFKARMADESSVEAMARLALTAALSGNFDVVEDFTQRILKPDLYDDASGCIRSKPRAVSFCYSPALMVVLGQSHRFTEPPLGDRASALDWAVFDRGPEAWGIQADDRPAAYLVGSKKEVAHSLYDNWVALSTVPELGDQPIELEETNYAAHLATLEGLWADLVREMLHSAGRPMIRLRPWPYGTSWALSVRFDIDRAVTAEGVWAITRTQTRHLGGPAGSWYEIPGTGYATYLRQALRMTHQELGVHLLSTDDAARGVGSTMHSAPGAHYWRGRDTILGLEERGASYGEMLSVLFDLPRRAVVADGDTVRATRLSLLPIHFPLEGSTSDRDLTYFDLLSAQFDALRDRGGHVIVGAHPDLDPALLEDLLAREETGAAWVAPIADVVERIERLMSYGTVTVVDHGDDHVTLSALHYVADVAVEISPADGSAPYCVPAQMNAHQPRKIDLVGQG